MSKSEKRLKGTTRAPNGRWKAQISLGGKPKYLGTFDSQEEAHDVYLAAKSQRGTATKKKETPLISHVDGIQVHHSYLYAGGIGAGQALNGRRFLVEKFLPGKVVLGHEVLEEGTPPQKPRRINMDFLDRATEEKGPLQAAEPTLSERLAAEIRRIRASNPTDPVLAVLQDSLEQVQQEEQDTQEAIQVTALVTGQADVLKTIPWLITRVEDAVASDGLCLLGGALSPKEGLEWLSRHTTIAPQVLRKVIL